MHEQADNAPLIATFDLAVTGGLAEGGKLRAQRMIQVTPKGVRFLGEMSFDQYGELLRGWKMVREAWDVGLADIRAYGVSHFGEDPVHELFAQSGFDFADEMRAIRLGQMTLDLRLSSSLTNAHFHVLCGLVDDKQRGRWQALAEKENLTPHELQKSIAAGKVLREGEISESQGSNTGFASMQGLRFTFDLWERKMGGEEKIFALSVEHKTALLIELQKPGEFYLKLKTQLMGGAA